MTDAAVATVPARTRRRRSRRHSWPLVVAIGLFCVSAVLPLLFMAATAFRTEADWANSRIGLPTTFSFGAFERAWTSANIGVYFRNSAIVTFSTVALSVATATLAGYAFSKLRWRLSGAVYLFVLAWLAIPPLLLMVPIYVELVQLGLLDTYWGVILLYTALNLPFNVYLMTAYFKSVPDELIEAARIDGAGEFHIFRKIAFRLLGPGFVTVLLFTFVATWNNYFLPLVMLSEPKWYPLTVGLAQWNDQANASGGATSAFNLVITGALISVVPLIIAFVFLQRYWQSGLGTGGVKG
jgi:multiple sugar transport system permease protein